MSENKKNEKYNPLEGAAEKRAEDMESGDYGLGLPVTALFLNIIPFILFVWIPHALILLLICIFPICGFFMGLHGLSCGEKRMGRAGIVISKIAVAWMPVFIVTIIHLGSTGALMTGM